tara:strand:- start:886 stop:1221 length:336 start_codon:yes stop_codon:yes gene_type:complete
VLLVGAVVRTYCCPTKKKRRDMTIDYSSIPNPSSVETVKRYIEDGIRPGAFFTALFSYHLSALKYADPINKPLLEYWLDWMHFEMPGGTTGSREIVDQHIIDGGMRGKHDG